MTNLKYDSISTGLLALMTTDEIFRYAAATKIDRYESARLLLAARLILEVVATMSFEERVMWMEAETDSIARVIATGEVRGQILAAVIDRLAM
jgi:hypothetical protein